LSRATPWPLLRLDASLLADDLATRQKDWQAATELLKLSDIDPSSHNEVFHFLKGASQFAEFIPFGSIERFIGRCAAMQDDGASIGNEDVSLDAAAAYRMVCQGAPVAWGWYQRLILTLVPMEGGAPTYQDPLRLVLDEESEGFHALTEVLADAMEWCQGLDQGFIDAELAPYQLSFHQQTQSPFLTSPDNEGHEFFMAAEMLGAHSLAAYLALAIKRELADDRQRNWSYRYLMDRLYGYLLARLPFVDATLREAARSLRILET
jgi:hypothetical protein